MLKNEKKEYFDDSTIPNGSECIYHKGVHCRPLETLKTHKQLNPCDDECGSYGPSVYELLVAFCGFCYKKEMIEDSIKRDIYGIKTNHMKLKRISGLLDQLDEELRDAVMDDFIKKLDLPEDELKSRDELLDPESY